MGKPWYDRPLSPVGWVFGGVALVGWVGVAFLWLLLADARWDLDIEQAVEVGMVAGEINDRLGPPDHIYGKDAPGDAWQGGFTHPELPIEHELWIWTFLSPSYCGHRLYVYVDEEGRVTSKFLGST